MTIKNFSVRFSSVVSDIELTAAGKGALVKFVITRRSPEFVIGCKVGVEVSTTAVFAFRYVLMGK